MTYISPLLCCGVKELVGVSDATPAQFLWELKTEDEGCTSRNFVFTDITQHRKSSQIGGWAFAKFIRRKRLGTVLGPSKPGKNPNTRNLVCVWVWTPNVKAVQRWFAVEDARRNKDADET